MTEWHNRYRGPGVMVYWHVERRRACITASSGLKARLVLDIGILTTLPL